MSETCCYCCNLTCAVVAIIVVLFSIVLKLFRIGRRRVPTVAFHVTCFVGH